MVSDSPIFDDAARELYESIVSGTEPEPDVLRVVLDHLRLFVLHRWPRVGTEGASDASSDAVAGLVSAISGGSEVDNPAAYLLSSASNTVRQAATRKSRDLRTSFSRALEEVDEDFEPTIERLAAEADVAAAHRAALAWRDSDGRPDAIALRVLACYRNLAVSGRSPNTREVAEEAQVSHVTVQRVYAQLRAFLASDRSKWVPRDQTRTR